MRRPKFHLPEEIVEDIVDAIYNCSVFLDVQNKNFVLPDPNDVVFFDLTVTARESEFKGAMLVTGNIKHFLQRGFVVTPREFLDMVLEGREGM